MRTSHTISSSGSAVSSSASSMTASSLATLACVISGSGISSVCSSSTRKLSTLPSTAASPQFHPLYETRTSCSSTSNVLWQCPLIVSLS